MYIYIWLLVRFFWNVFGWQFNTDLQGHLLLCWSILINFFNVRLQLFSCQFQFLGWNSCQGPLQCKEPFSWTGWHVFSEPGCNPLPSSMFFGIGLFFAIMVVTSCHRFDMFSNKTRKVRPTRLVPSCEMFECQMYNNFQPGNVYL